MLEHPKSAKPWQEPGLKKLCNMTVAITVGLDMCRYGMIDRDEIGRSLVKKTTRTVTNSWVLAQAIGKRCQSNGGPEDHRHVLLLNGRAKRVQTYPRRLCEEVARATKQQLLEACYEQELCQLCDAEAESDTFSSEDNIKPEDSRNTENSQNLL